MDSKELIAQAIDEEVALHGESTDTVDFRPAILKVAPSVAHIELKDNAYRFLWLKYINGFDQSQHCARCLKGYYSKGIPYKAAVAGAKFTITLNEGEGSIHKYLCGVTSKWAENLHIAFYWLPDETIEYEDAHAKITITHAKQIPIHPITDDLGLPKAFMTCRNFQFGYEYLRG